MTNTLAGPDRSRDISQPLEKLGPDEAMKVRSDYLRGTINEGLLDAITGAVSGDDNAKLMKFHGVYVQDDRDLRDERRRQKLEPAYSFLIRLRLPGGVATAAQWLKLDELARAYGNSSLRVTTRQTFQFHWVLKNDLKATIQGLHEVLIDTIAACGDVVRGVMASVNPSLSSLHAEVYDDARRVSEHAMPNMRAYHEIWYGEERVATSEPEEPFLGKQYLPRKFKIGLVIPPYNDIDVYTQDLGFIAIAENGRLIGYNIVIGGGMGRTDQAPETYPRLGDVIGFIPKEQILAATDAVVGTQRDFGDRTVRAHARFKYTIDTHGLDFIQGEIERRLGYALEPARPFEFVSNGDAYGWAKGENGRYHYTLFIENGRIVNREDVALLDGLRAIAAVHQGSFRMTPNQNVVIADIPAKQKPKIAALLREYGLDHRNEQSLLRLNSMACVALPTCGLAMAESERYLPTLVTKIETILAEKGLEKEPITIRMTGCPNGCARPYVAEIALTGRAPGKYNLYFGGGFHGQRLNKMYLENVGEDAILQAVDAIAGHYAQDKNPGEHFGDFTIRAGYVKEVRAGREFND
ncbi:sulfite reductase (NADPH) hemoprotein, beta-component [Methylocella silvestris BL2]|uniref:Sulfite reductase [NADPH] hemoprotein beta-component n=1 Tax=Methylocella silvestris (strain DSM 15510 / CIP 108128 / LMG 27833 / NCIMB 13906 / BL2) TaxID=395965 RepID=CYSI_METSB|nr:assimilatory sulfite reductase (NADPH) hemoprotein subunit [Methylocella silvestris]B8EKI5.1 RecName: Full=Sulfite reductase [NADPH] hemoprotein beta-component; Short=SiR-HP; Short=SiRHP [Methylocella silvestris BL2]ACK51355.1 sulfite reductase (NADPH) hemoprotein, beta-component [Methylocella silvestris BL2]